VTKDTLQPAGVLSIV
jgi:hypothetical protein